MKIATVVLLYFTLSITLYGQSSQKFINDHFSNVSKKSIPDSLIRISEKYAEENPDTALFLAKIAFEMASVRRNNKLLALASQRIAEALYYKNEFREAVGYYLKAADAELLQSGDTTGFVAERLTDAAYCYQELGIYEKALELNLLSLRIQEKSGNTVEIGNNLCNIGTNYYFKSQYNKAIEYFQRTLELDRKSGDSAAMAISLNNLGMVYSRWGKHLKAIEFYIDALNYTTEESRKSIRMSNAGMSYFHLGNYDKALEYLNEALKLDIKFNQQLKIGIRKNEIGTVLAALGKYGEAIKLMEEALEVFTAAGVTDSKIILLADMGDVSLKTGSVEKAEKYYKESAELAKATGALHHLARNYKSLYEIAEKKSNYKQAFSYLLSYKSIYDSIFNVQKHQDIARFEILYETEKKDNENRRLVQNIELKKREQKAALIMIVTLVLLVLLLINFYRNKSKSLKQSRLLLMQSEELASARLEIKEHEKQILEDRVFAEKQINRLEHEKYLSDLNLKNTELASITLSLIQKNDILKTINQKLSSNHSPDSMQELMNYVRTKLDFDQDWKKFRVDYEKVHPGFFERLIKKYPQLTDHDIRLAAYLRLNLSSKEISDLMNVSILATNKSRQRLRKKLGMPADAAFQTFFSHI